VSAVGARESSEFKRQTQLIRAAWPRNARAHIEVEGADHLTVCDVLAEPDSPLFAAALELVRGI
jgi:arylformamidase